MKESKSYFSKELLLGTLTPLRKIIFVGREKKFYQKNGLGIWWKLNTGIGIHGKPGRILRHFMFGANIFNKVCWIEISYLGYTKEDSKLAMYDQGEEVKIPKGIMDKWNNKVSEVEIKLDSNKFYCDGCGEGYENENEFKVVSSPTLAGISMCKTCSK